MTNEPTAAVPSSERAGIVGVLVGSLAILCAMAVPHVLGRAYTLDDLSAFHYPLRLFYSDCLKHGFTFDWMPTLFAGFFVSGEGQLGAYHPYHWLIYRVLPVRTAFDVELLSSYPFMLVGTYLFLRPVVQRRDAALFGAMVFTFSGFNALHFVHPNAVAVVAHIPWLLWAIGLASERTVRRRLAGEVAFSLLTASQLLLGYPQYVWFSLLAEMAWAAFLLRRRWKDYIRLGLFAGLGLMIGAVQVLPTWDFLRESGRGSPDLAFVLSGSMVPLDTMQLLAPYLFTTRSLGGNTHEFGLYLGAVPLVLAAWTFRGRWLVDAEGSLLRGAWWFLAAALLLAWGRFGGLAILQASLPVVGSFRVPARALVLVHLAGAVVASLGFAKIADGRADAERRGLLRVAVGLAIFSATVSLAAPWGLSSPPRVAGWQWVAAGPLLVAAGGGLCCLFATSRSRAVWALVLFTAADLGFYGASYAIFPELGGQHAQWPVPAAPPGEPGERVVSEPRTFDAARFARTGNFFVERGFVQVDGYAGLEPTTRLFGRSASVAALRVAAVRWVYGPANPRETNGLRAASPSWCAVERPMQRIRLLSRVHHSTVPSRDITWIDVETTALVEESVLVDLARPGSVRLLAERPGLLAVATQAPGRQLLVVADRFHSGWRASVDGVSAPVVRVNGDFLGCPVPAGDHVVRLAFRPASLLIGRVVSLLGFALLILRAGAGLVLPAFLVLTRP